MRSLNKADKDRGDKLREMGCIVCLNVFNVYSPTAIHHLDGQTKEGCHQLTIPLCPRHHQIKDNVKPPQWFAFHGDKTSFEIEYGTQYELLEQVNGLIA
jgi:hypothetical protein